MGKVRHGLDRAWGLAFGWFRDVYRSRRLILDLANKDFKSRYAASYLGIIWAFVQPIVTVSIYILVFQVGFKQGMKRNVPFALWLTVGIVPYLFFQEALLSATNSLMEFSYLVKKVVFRVEVLPIIKMISCLIVHLIFVFIMLGLYLCFGWIPKIYWVQTLYYTMAVFLFSIALVYFTSAVQVFFKDMSQIVNICLQFGMWLIPIMWQEEQFAGRSYYPVVQAVVKLNPMYYVMTGYRDSMLLGNGFWEKPRQTLYFWAVTLCVGFVGLKVFKRLRPHFSDVL